MTNREKGAAGPGVGGCGYAPSKTRAGTPPRKGRQRVFDDECRAACLACLKAHGGNVKRTARMCGVDPRTLRHWRDGHGPTSRRAREMADGAAAVLAEVLDRWAHRYLGEVERKLGGTDALTAAKVAGHCVAMCGHLGGPRHGEGRSAATSAADLGLDRLTVEERAEYRRLRDKAAGTGPARPKRGVRLERVGLRPTFALADVGLSVGAVQDEVEQLLVTARQRQAERS